MDCFTQFIRASGLILLVIIMMKTVFCAIQKNTCFEVSIQKRNDRNSSVSHLQHGHILNLTQTANDSVIQLSCSAASDQQGFYAEIYEADCSNLYNASLYVPLNTSSGLNHVTENNCERSNNCKAYSITPKIEECLVLKCSRGTRNVKTCTNYITVMNIRHPPPPTTEVEETKGSKIIPIITGTVTGVVICLAMVILMILLLLVYFLKKRRRNILCSTHVDTPKEDEVHVTVANEDSPKQNMAVREQVPTQEQEDDLSMTRSNSDLALNSRATFTRSRGIHRSASLQEDAGKISGEEELPNGPISHRNVFSGEDEQCSSNGETSYQQETNGSQTSDTRIYPTNIYDPKQGEDYILRRAESYPKKMYYITEEQNSKV